MYKHYFLQIIYIYHKQERFDLSAYCSTFLARVDGQLQEAVLGKLTTDIKPAQHFQCTYFPYSGILVSFSYKRTDKIIFM
jgi:hypothetical protein